MKRKSEDFNSNEDKIDDINEVNENIQLSKISNKETQKKNKM